MLNYCADMASKNPERKSLDLLINVISENDWLDLIYFTPKKIEVRIQGDSKRWYSVTANLVDQNLRGNLPNHIKWTISVVGAARKGDIATKNRYSADICIHARNNVTERYPVGDRIASLALSLRNDIRTAMTIPLLAQFIVCKREFLAEVLVFQEEGIMTEAMIDGPFFEEEIVEEDIVEPQVIHVDPPYMDEVHPEDFLNDDDEDWLDYIAQASHEELERQSTEEELYDFMERNESDDN